jgi:hypothetical protein
VCVCVCLSGQFPGTARTFFFWWVLFSVSVKLPRPLCFFFFFGWWVLFFVSVKLTGPLFLLDGFCSLCQLNCPDLCFFVFFFDGFCFLRQLNCSDLFFFFLLDGCIMHRVHSSLLKMKVWMKRGNQIMLGSQIHEMPTILKHYFQWG